MQRGAERGQSIVRRLAGLLILLVLTGCGRSLSAASLPDGLTDLLRPTWTPVSTEPVTLELDPVPTAEPTPTDRPDPTPIPFALGAEVYRHTDGLFQAPLPAGWTVTEEAEDQVVLSDGRWRRSARIGVTYTGAALDEAAFERFVTAREENRFGSRADYERLSEDIDLAGRTAVFEKVYTESRQTVWAASYYLQMGDAVAWVDFQQPNYLTPYLSPPPVDWAGQLKVDPLRAAELAPYTEVIDLSAPGGLFQLQVPAAWSYRKGVRDSVTAHLITSPNRNNRIQLILFDEGLPLTRQEAGNLALELVRSLNSGAVQISAAIVRSDGVEYLLWSRVEDGSRGQSFFTVRGTTFLMLTILEIDPQSETDRIPLEAVKKSFHLP